jgi:hypothetical protein
MTGVMPLGERLHGFGGQVVTGFTLGYWRGKIRLSTKNTNGHEENQKEFSAIQNLF